MSVKNTLHVRDGRSLLHTYNRLTACIESGRGQYLIDSEGASYLDLFGGLAVNALGYCNEEILVAMHNQLSKFAHLSNYFVQGPQVLLAERLLSLSAFDKVFFTNSGTEATEAAIKLCRKWGRSRGKTELIGFHGSFHGRTMGALSLMSQEKYTDGYEPFLDQCVHLEFNSAEQLTAHISHSTCAVFFECIQGEGGIRPVTKSFIETLFALREQYGFLIVADEIQSGMWRTGTFFSYEQWNVQPDITLVAKAIGGGLPLGAMLVTAMLSEVLRPGMHGTTFGGNPVACAGGLALLEYIATHNLQERISDIGKEFLSGFGILQKKYSPLVREIRGLGCMIGVELTKPALPIAEECFRHGVFLNVTQGNVIRLLPPYIITDDDISRALEVIGSVFALQQ